MLNILLAYEIDKERKAWKFNIRNEKGNKTSRIIKMATNQYFENILVDLKKGKINKFLEKYVIKLTQEVIEAQIAYY